MAAFLLPEKIGAGLFECEWSFSSVSGAFRPLFRAGAKCVAKIVPVLPQKRHEKRHIAKTVPVSAPKRHEKRHISEIVSVLPREDKTDSQPFLSCFSGFYVIYGQFNGLIFQKCYIFLI